MTDMIAITALLQQYQSVTRTELATAALKQRAQADQAMAHMLAEQVKAAAGAGSSAPAGRISIMV